MLDRPDLHYGAVDGLRQEFVDRIPPLIPKRRPFHGGRTASNGIRDKLWAPPYRIAESRLRAKATRGV